eukprot:NODE_4044_length_1239_cov_62.655914_g3553_i0.p1 GENE.NODE_4044_length_1239_cov_62.655914_g3553_i0~~NODE_4044_length_1239_cov_62.655914_g3553_i0.p1  ORF type:complete len:379 (+),score=59.22 NODE_4044_length_1239_cov_62.655914_g3553_i0:56-1138(+)
MFILLTYLISVVWAGPDSNFWNPAPVVRYSINPRDNQLDRYANDLLWNTQRQIVNGNRPLTRVNIFGHLVATQRVNTSWCVTGSLQCYQSTHEASGQMAGPDPNAFVVLLTRLIKIGTVQPTRVGKGVDFVYADSRKYPYGVNPSLAVFKNDMMTALQFQRTADSRLRVNDSVGSLNAMRSFQSTWDLIQRRYAANPPEAFLTDQEWRSSIESIRLATVSAITSLTRANITQSKPIVSSIESLMTKLRKRNGLVFWADYVIKADLGIQNLDSFTLNVASTAQQWDSARDVVAVAKYLYRDAIANVPDSISSNAAFSSHVSNLDAAFVDVDQYSSVRSPINFETAKSTLKTRWNSFWAQWV